MKYVVHVDFTEGETRFTGFCDGRDGFTADVAAAYRFDSYALAWETAEQFLDADVILELRINWIAE